MGKSKAFIIKHCKEILYFMERSIKVMNLQNEYLGRSYGYPIVPQKLTKKIINSIRDVACLFIYHPSKKYLKQSVFINN